MNYVANSYEIWNYIMAINGAIWSFKKINGLKIHLHREVISGINVVECPSGKKSTAGGTNTGPSVAQCHRKDAEICRCC